jgi:DNA polymerase III sliding clamp (beta) subunit (PCNA family)
MGEIAKLLKRDCKEDGEVQVAATSALVSLSTETSQLIVRLAENDFPHYRDAIPTMPAVAQFEVRQEVLMAALKRLAPLTGQYQKTIKCTVQGASLLLNYETLAGGGAEDVAVVMTSTPPSPFLTGINLPHWTEALATIPKESTVEFRFVDHLRPCRITDRDDECWSYYVGQVQVV